MTALLTALLLAAPAPAPKVVLEPDPGNFKRLQPRSLTASSFLKNGWNAYEQNYLPLYAADDDPATAWVEGADGPGVGESLLWMGPRLKKAKSYKLFFRSGYQKSKVLFEANARPRKLRLEPLKPGEVAPVPAGKALEVELADQIGWQEVNLPTEPDVAGVRVTLLSVYKGKKYEDTCLSDLRVYVDAEDPYQSGAEYAAADAIRKFVAARKMAAAQPDRPGPRLAAAYKQVKAEHSDKLAKACPRCNESATALLEAVPKLGEGEKFKAALARARTAAALWDGRATDKGWRTDSVAGAEVVRAQLYTTMETLLGYQDALPNMGPYLAVQSLTRPAPPPPPADPDGPPPEWNAPPSFRALGPAAELRALEVEWTGMVGEREARPERFKALVHYEQGLAGAVVTSDEAGHGVEVYVLEWQPGVSGPTLSAITRVRFIPQYSEPTEGEEAETVIPAQIEATRYEAS